MFVLVIDDELTKGIRTGVGVREGALVYDVVLAEEKINLNSG